MTRTTRRGSPSTWLRAGRRQPQRAPSVSNSSFRRLHRLHRNSRPSRIRRRGPRAGSAVPLLGHLDPRVLEVDDVHLQRLHQKVLVIPTAGTGQRHACLLFRRQSGSPKILDSMGRYRQAQCRSDVRVRSWAGSHRSARACRNALSVGIGPENDDRASGAGRLRGIEKLCNDPAVGKKRMCGLPIEIGLRVMFGTPSTGLELHHRDFHRRTRQSMVPRTTPPPKRERERDLVERRHPTDRALEARWGEKARYAAAARRISASRSVTRNRLFHAHQRRESRRDPLIAHRAARPSRCSNRWTSEPTRRSESSPSAVARSSRHPRSRRHGLARRSDVTRAGRSRCRCHAVRRGCSRESLARGSGPAARGDAQTRRT